MYERMEEERARLTLFYLYFFLCSLLYHNNRVLSQLQTRTVRECVRVVPRADSLLLKSGVCECVRLWRVRLTVLIVILLFSNASSA